MKTRDQWHTDLLEIEGYIKKDILKYCNHPGVLLPILYKRLCKLFNHPNILEMKTTIHITGQVNGNSRLRSAIITASCKETKGMFNSVLLEYPTKCEAIKALSQGYISLCQSMPEEKGKISGIRYTRGYSLAYDASRAVII